MQEALNWGKDEGITFDHLKLELKHFSRSTKNPSPLPKIIVGTYEVEDLPKPLRWLGVFYDRKLRFKEHVSILSAKALTIANALRSLGKTTRGIPPIFLRQAATACVLKKAYFAAETWWPGRTRAARTNRVSNQVDAHLRLLEKVVLTSARAILPVYRTTQTAVLYKEALLRPPEIELNSATQSFAARTHRLDLRHPLRKRAEEIIRSGKPTSRFARQILALPRAEWVDPIAQPPWRATKSREATERRISGPQNRTKEEAARDFISFLTSIPPKDIQVFSDGSKSEATDGATGGGFVSYQYGHLINRKAFSLGRNAEVFDAEASAALEGAKTALALPSARLATDLWVFLDNLEVAMRLLDHSTGSSQSVFDEFTEVARLWPLRTRLPHTQPGSVRIRWVPGHLNIQGNEEADKAAKEGARLPTPTNAICSLASLKRLAKTEAKRALGQLWLSTAPASYIDLRISYSSSPYELYLDRAALGRILATRTNHGDFATYHIRFDHINATLTCSCGYKKTPLHFFFCRLGKARIAFKGAPSEVIPSLLGTTKGAARLAKWLTDSQFYQKTCPAYSRAELDL
jgi:ribonuclease HI